MKNKTKTCGIALRFTRLTGNYAELHGHADVDGNGKVYSNIGVVLYDYSNGTGNNTVKVYVNVTPEDIY